MALLDDLLEGNPLVGIVVGAGAVLLPPNGRPGAAANSKELIKDALLAYQGVADLGETLGGVVAEAQYDVGQQDLAEVEPKSKPTSGGSRREPKP